MSFTEGKKVGLGWLGWWIMIRFSLGNIGIPSLKLAKAPENSIEDDPYLFGMPIFRGFHSLFVSGRVMVREPLTYSNKRKGPTVDGKNPAPPEIYKNHVDK